jgi:hypothetical protein
MVDFEGLRQKHLICITSQGNGGKTRPEPGLAVN